MKAFQVYDRKVVNFIMSKVNKKIVSALAASGP